MFVYVISLAYWFFVVIQYAVLIYTLVSWIKGLAKFQKTMSDVMDPLLKPVQRMLNRSVFRLSGVDMSPIIVYLVAGYGAQLCLLLR